MEELIVASGMANLSKAKEYRDRANRAMSVENYREALRLFHQCILLARGVVQTSSVLIHQHSNFSAALQPPAESAEVDERTKIVANECANRTAAEESTKNEAHRLMIECYLNLADCVLNGNSRSREDYRRALVYCDNVLEYEPDDKQRENATMTKGTAYMKLSEWRNAISNFEQLPQNELAQQLIQECTRKQSDERRKRDQMIQANFAKQNQNNERNGHADGQGMNGHAQNGYVR